MKKKQTLREQLDSCQMGKELGGVRKEVERIKNTIF